MKGKSRDEMYQKALLLPLPSKILALERRPFFFHIFLIKNALIMISSATLLYYFKSTCNHLLVMAGCELLRAGILSYSSGNPRQPRECSAS